VVEVVCSELREVETTGWRQQKEEGTDLQPVHQWVELKQWHPWEEAAILSPVTKGLWANFGALRLCDGVLQRAWKEPTTGEVSWQVVVPRSLHEEVLRAVHSAVGSGHFGVTKTLRLLRQVFYWGQHKRDVEDFCCRCESCTARKGPHDRYLPSSSSAPWGSP